MSVKRAWLGGYCGVAGRFLSLGRGSVTKGFLNYFSVIIESLEVVFKGEIVKFSKNCDIFAIKESGGVKVQVMKFQKDNNNNKLPKWFREE